MQDRIKAFINGLFLATTEGREHMTTEEATYNIKQWKVEQWEDIPEGLTAETLSKVWNELIEMEGHENV